MLDISGTSVQWDARDVVATAQGAVCFRGRIPGRDQLYNTIGWYGSVAPGQAGIK